MLAHGNEFAGEIFEDDFFEQQQYALNVNISNFLTVLYFTVL
jgi:hypothetical protein